MLIATNVLLWYLVDLTDQGRLLFGSRRWQVDFESGFFVSRHWRTSNTSEVLFEIPGILYGAIWIVNVILLALVLRNYHENKSI